MIGRIVAAVALVFGLAGCASKAPAGTAFGGRGGAGSTNAPVKTDGSVRPIYPVSGRVALVNDKARFVIIDFTNSRPPELEQRLSLYRAGLKVAEVKVSGPFRNATVAADITAGEARYGDEVKSE